MAGELEIVQRRGGWFVIDEANGWSGPWRTRYSAELARDKKYDQAHIADKAA